MKRTVSTFREAKCTGKKLAMVTAYDYTTAKLADTGNIDAILVGDSLGMVCLGYKDTLGVTIEDMIHHTRAVSNGVKDALLVGDMPFMSYQTSVYDAVKNAGRLVQQAHAEAVKLEGGAVVLEQVKAIVNAQIPVMGHIGLTPQSSNLFGGFKVQGKEASAAKKIIEDAKRLEDAGAFSIVLECVPSEIAKMITESVSIPTIGIGAGANCDGQVLVFHDLLGMNEGFNPKFVKVFENVGELIKSGINKYANEVHASTFPEEKHTFTIKKSELDKL